ncbi:MAG: aminoacyl-tRNA hydrolase [Cyclobacteriaceae bacterium]|nr:aminoacyl-tRNA hydrolase [Cyclobacteriaceae bacterium]MCH8514869.1 aminoacyl-tRNA hydrolase [Cyclobacteriaceae bacterium]
MKYLIVGLGNPGAKYVDTRHNIGFMVVDHLAQSQKVQFSEDKLGSIANFKYKGRLFYLLKPNTYMNLSGKSVNYHLQQLKISVENLLVITDDIALDFGRLRLRVKGSAGGHNGLKSIEATLQTAKYCRLKFGVGNDFHSGMQADYVLSDFDLNEQKELGESLLERASQMALSFGTIGPIHTMNQFNQ